MDFELVLSFVVAMVSIELDQVQVACQLPCGLSCSINPHGTASGKICITMNPSHSRGPDGSYFENPGHPEPPAADGYAGDVSPQLACAWWQAGDAVLVDVRTDAEREWVGFIPGAITIAWKQWPGMHVNEAFEAQLQAAVPAGKKVVLLCRSGVRSIAAARCAAALGLEAYNILEGFEGDPDDQAQRGVRGGWRLHGLPWRQN